MKRKCCRNPLSLLVLFVLGGTLWAAPTLAVTPMVVAGSSHTLAIKDDGTLWAWGFNFDGEVGDGTTEDKGTPTRIGTASDWQSVAAGYYHSVAIKSDGTLWAWGSNNYGQLGDGTTVNKSAPMQIGTENHWQSVSTKGYHTVAIKSDGTLWAWGNNAYGALGDGTAQDRNIPGQVGTEKSWLRAAAGGYSTLAIKADGTLWGWGENWSGQLGDGTTEDKSIPTRIGTASNWQRVEVGDHHTVAIKSDGTLWTWGRNGEGQLGDSTTIDQNVPIPIGTANNWQGAAVGWMHTIAVKSDGTLWAWGKNSKGEFGNGTTIDQSSPVQIGTATSWQSVSTGDSHVVALSSDGSVWSWGWNDSGQLGNGLIGNKLTPVAIAAANRWQGITAGGSHTLALRNDGTLWGWGYNESGQLGDGTFSSKKTPVAIGSSGNWRSVAAGGYFTAAIKNDNTLWAWGRNGEGQLGDGTTVDRNIPGQVGTASDWLSLAAGENHILALKQDGTLWGWGANWFGQLGDGTIDNKIRPVQIGSANDWSSVAAGGGHTMALKNDGTLWGWGANWNGSLGDNSLVNRRSPVQIGTANDWRSVAAGEFHTLALKQDNSLWAWGYNYFGQLGDGTTVDQKTPEQIGTGNNWQSLAVGGYHSFALRGDNSLWAWGGNWVGQLGEMTTSGRTLPVELGPARNWSRLVAGNAHSVALLDDGTLRAWGDNGEGELGDGTAWQESPGMVLSLRAAPPVDTIAPVVSFTSSRSGLSSVATTIVTYSASEPATLSLTRNGIGAAVASGGTLELLEGLNLLTVTATDPSNNIGSAVLTVTVDTRIVAPTIDPLPATWNRSSYTLSGRMEDQAAVVVTAPAGVSVGGTDYPTPSSWRCLVSNLASGAVDFTAIATDLAGNVSAPVRATLAIDLAIPPALSNSELVVSDTLQGGTVLVDWEAYRPDPAVAGYALYVSPTPITTITGLSPWRIYGATTTAATVTGLIDDQASAIAVVPTNAGGEFERSNLSSVSVTPRRQGIYGTITDFFSAYPLNGMEIRVDGSPPALTDREGNYRLTGLTAGDYTVMISEPGGMEIRYYGSELGGRVSNGTMTRLDESLFAKVHNLTPGVPQNCTGLAGDNKVTLRWEGVMVPDLAGYYLYRDGILLNAVPWPDTTYVDLTAVNGTTYTYTLTTTVRNDVRSLESAPVTATPQALVRPPLDLSAKLNCDRSVTLTWVPPVSSNLAGYHLYFQPGSTIAYNGYETIADPALTSWTSPELASGTWTFALRAYGSSEEENTTQRITLTIPPSWDRPQGIITIPKAGKRIDGNALHVQAEPAGSGCGSPSVSSIRFQYAPVGSAEWLDIPAALAQHPNPDLTSPFFTKWDVTLLAEGDYGLRAVAENSTASDSAPAAIVVTVDHHQPQLVEQGSDNGQSGQGFVEKGSAAPVTTGAVSVLFAPQSLATDTYLTIAPLAAEEQPANNTLLAPPVALSLSSGQKLFPAGEEAEVALSYLDSDNDNIIDGSGFFIQDVLPSSYNPATSLWEGLSSVTLDRNRQELKGKTSHFSLFGLTPVVGLPRAEPPFALFAPAASSSGLYQLNWNVGSGSGLVYEVEEAENNTFMTKVSTVYVGADNFTFLNRGNGSYFYRVRTAQPGHQPSPWTARAAPVTVDLACGGIAALYAPEKNSSGSYRLSWIRSATPGVSYIIEVDDGSGFRYLTATPRTYLDLRLLPDGTYRYRVMAEKSGYLSSPWTNSPATKVVRSLPSAAPQTLTVLKPGAGSGTVTSLLPGIVCGSSCTQSYPVGTIVTLVAAPAPDSLFQGWGGACSGRESCAVTMDVAKEVTATFTRPATAVTLTADLSSPQNRGTSITLSGAASGGDAGPYEYRFWWRSTLAGAKWILAQDYSLRADWTWESAALALAAGSYYLEVDTRHVGNPLRSEATKILTYKLLPLFPPVTSLTLSPDSTPPRPPGTTVTFTAAAGGVDAGPYEYRFWWRSTSAGAIWRVGQEYAAKSDWEWKSAELGLTPGSYYIQVDVRHVGSTLRSEKVNSLTYSLR